MSAWRNVKSKVRFLAHLLQQARRGTGMQPKGSARTRNGLAGSNPAALNLSLASYCNGLQAVLPRLTVSLAGQRL